MNLMPRQTLLVELLEEWIWVELFHIPYARFHEDILGILLMVMLSALAVSRTFQGTELTPGIRKIRMPIASKGRGKSGGARVITANAIIAEHEGRIALLTIYDKEDASTVKLNVIKQMARELGFDV